jgi:hypothetical protein
MGGRVITVLLAVLSIWSCSIPPVPLSNAPTSFSHSQGIDGSWDSLGYKKGQHVPNFILYTADGIPFRLDHELEKGKPIVLINGSYTCDVSRANLPAIKAITNKYKDTLNIVVVYTIEAHPADTASPYSYEKEWQAPDNIRDSISANQPNTYGERVALAQQWQEENQIIVPILIDSPDNVYWHFFGQAPNMAYLIEPGGTVYYKQSWFREEELEEQIQVLLDDGLEQQVSEQP